jgi:phosphoribosyl-dephospho-CoA transferase
MPPAESLRRHDWVYLPADWREKLVAPLPPEDSDAVTHWIEKSRPIVVARSLEGDAPGLLRLGLALPGKRRIGLQLPASAVRLTRQAPFFLDAAPSAGAFWPEALAALSHMFERHAPRMRVFGSFAWQFLADELSYCYVTAQSDIDLLLEPESNEQLWAWLEHLGEFESRFASPRLDGEIVLPDGDFVAWREYSMRPSRILAKGARSLRLRPFEEISRLFPARAA